MSVLRFYYCSACGAMSMKNFRDGACGSCHVAMKVNTVEVCATEFGLNVNDYPAAHTESENGK